jgi:hypothetical protein
VNEKAIELTPLIEPGGPVKIAYPLVEAAGLLSIAPKQLKTLANKRDIAHLEIDGELYFRPEALREWAQRNESKVW